MIVNYNNSKVIGTSQDNSQHSNVTTGLISLITILFTGILIGLVNFIVASSLRVPIVPISLMTLLSMVVMIDLFNFLFKYSLVVSIGLFSLIIVLYKVLLLSHSTQSGYLL